jgi:hypothetical protein
MKKLAITCAALAVIPLTFTEASTCSMEGLAIMQEQEKRHTVKYENEEQELTLTDLKSNSNQSRTIRRFKKDLGPGENKSLIVFMAPNDIKGTALLNWKNETREDDQWLYLPALKKTQRIAGSEKKKYFMGTDFTYADLESEGISNYNYKCLETKKCGKDDCFIIEALPKDKQIENRTGYSKRIITVDNKNFTSRQIEFFDARGSLLKTLKNSRWKKLGDTAYRAERSEMERAGFHKTTIEVKSRALDEKIDDITFTERYIEKGMHIR